MEDIEKSHFIFVQKTHEYLGFSHFFEHPRIQTQKPNDEALVFMIPYTDQANCCSHTRFVPRIFASPRTNHGRAVYKA